MRPPLYRIWVFSKVSRVMRAKEEPAMAEQSTWRTKVGLAEMLKGGVIMDVTTAEQAKIAEDAGAVAVMALERGPADIRAQGGGAGMAAGSGEGAAMTRTKGEAGSGNIVEAVRHMRKVTGHIKRLTTLGPEELMTEAKELGAPYDLVRWVAQNGRLPVPNFAAGGVAPPPDGAPVMELGGGAVFGGA